MPITDIVTVSRPSGGSYFDADGVMQWAANNQWRRDHDPVTKEPLGVLIEEQRTNLLPDSAQIGNPNWALFSGTAATLNAAVAPDGSMTASRIDFSSGSSNNRAFRSVGLAAPGEIRTNSCWLWGAVGGEAVRISGFDGTNGYIDGPEIILTKTPARHSFSYPITQADTTFFAVRNSAFGGVKSIYAWGAQAEVGAIPSSYIPTTSAAATRAADSIYVQPLAPWFTPERGSMIVDMYDMTPIPISGFQYVTAFSQGTSTATYLGFSKASSGINVRSSLGNAPYQPFTLGRNKLALTYGSAGLKFAKDGVVGSLQTSASGSFPALSRLQVGGLAGSVGVVAYIRAIRYFPRVLSDTELQALTA